MKRVLFVLLLVTILAFAGCAGTTDAAMEAKKEAASDANGVVTEASQGLVTERDTVEIGEMI